jgi:hypothetical protein
MMENEKGYGAEDEIRIRAMCSSSRTWSHEPQGQRFARLRVVSRPSP